MCVGIAFIIIGAFLAYIGVEAWRDGYVLADVWVYLVLGLILFAAGIVLGVCTP